METTRIGSVLIFGISNVYALNPDFMYLLYILNLKVDFSSCDIVLFEPTL